VRIAVRATFWEAALKTSSSSIHGSAVLLPVMVKTEELYVHRVEPVLIGQMRDRGTEMGSRHRFGVTDHFLEGYDVGAGRTTMITSAKDKNAVLTELMHPAS